MSRIISIRKDTCVEYKGVAFHDTDLVVVCCPISTRPLLKSKATCGMVKLYCCHYWHFEPGTKWATFCRRHLLMYLKHDSYCILFDVVIACSSKGQVDNRSSLVLPVLGAGWVTEHTDARVCACLCVCRPQRVSSDIQIHLLEKKLLYFVSILKCLQTSVSWEFSENTCVDYPYRVWRISLYNYTTEQNGRWSNESTIWYNYRNF